MKNNYSAIFLILSLLVITHVNAQVDRAFIERSSFNVKGNIELVGNVLLTCDGSGDCADVQDGTTSGNNGRQMAYVNTDVAAGFSNSSSADLTLPAGSTVLYAGLYWGGRATDGDANRESIQIRVAGSATYTTVNSSVIDTFSSDGEVGSRPYQAFADITSLVAAAGDGSYFVGDLTAASGNDGLGFYGGWSMTVLYEDNNQPFRRLVVFDGAARVTGTDTISITVTDLLTPLSGSFETFVGAMVWEGDEGISGDSFVFEGNTINQALNPSTNFWNSSITNQDARVTTKSPDYVNQLAMDLDFFDVSGLLPNAATTADIDFITGGDWYYPNYLVFVTELYLPDFGSTMTKTAIDLNGGDVLPNDVIEYTISINNAGQDGATNTVLTDIIPTNMTYVTNSLEIVSADVGPTGVMTDIALDDAAEYDGINNEVVFRLGSGADENNGGTFLNTQGATVKFRVTIDDHTVAGDITNTASVVSNSFIFPADEFTSTADAVVSVIISPSLLVSKVATITTDNGNVGTVDENDIITFSVAVENTGNVDLTSLQVNDTMGGLLTCLPTTLAPDDSISCTDYTYTFLASDVTTGGFINNTATATALDPSLNSISADDSTATAITLDTPTITSPFDGSLLNDSTPTVTGTAIPGSIITVTGPLGETCITTTDGLGDWACDLSPALADGSNQIDVSASNGGINNSPIVSITINVDTQAPSAPVITTPTNGAPVSGTGEAGATVTVITPSGATCNAVVQANGTWSCTLVPSPVDGEDITADQTDPAGNTSVPVTVVGGVDTVAPSTPSIDSITNDTGTNAMDQITADNTLMINGVAEASSTVEVFVDGVSVGTIQTDGSGNWVFDNTGTTLADGSYAITVQSTDAAGNTSSVSTALTVVIDTSAPTGPGVLTGPTITNDPDADIIGSCGIDAANGTVVVTTIAANGFVTMYNTTIALDASGSFTIVDPNWAIGSYTLNFACTDAAGNGPNTLGPFGPVVIDTTAPAAPIVTSPSDGDLTNNNTPSVTGTAEAGSTVVVTGPNGETCSSVADVNGDWSCDIAPALGDGAHQLDVVATDPAGNGSTPTSVILNVDTQAPIAPVITTPTNGAPVSGTGEVGATVTVITPSGATCSAVVQANGTWSCTLVPSPVDGEDITADQTDPAGNTSVPVTVAGGVDTVAPAAPIVTSPSDGDLSNNNTPSVTGTAEAGSTVVVTGPNGETCSTVADVNGDWSCDIAPALGDGANQLDVVATDPAGNDSGTTSLILNVDTQAPSAPVITTPTNGAPVSGMGEAGATVTVTTPSGATCSAVVQANGTWSCTLAPSPVDGEDITADQTDPAGNTSVPVTVAGGVDTVAPAAPVIISPIDGISTNDSTPTVSGTGEPGSLITVTVTPNGETCTAPVDASGNWSCTLPALQNGSNVITAIASDVAGNESTPDSVSINIQSGTTYGLTVNAATELVTTEMGGIDTFEVLLPLTPTDNVSFTLSSSNTDEGTVSPSNVIFTPSNWNQAITITVTGVDDADYDFDQNYQIIISALSSSDGNYNGINPDDVDAVNIDDDESSDLSAFITNCVAGVLPNSSPEYQLFITNNGNKDISDAIVATVFPSELNTLIWDCATAGGSSCGAVSGTGDLSELVDLPVGSEVIYTFSTQTIGNLHDFIDVEGSVTMPVDETDVNPDDNTAYDSDLIYQFIFKDSFECVAPGTVGSTNKLLQNILQ